MPTDAVQSALQAPTTLGISTLVTPADMTPRARWVLEIENAEKEKKDFVKRGERAVEQFIDERDAINIDSRWFNIFYANTNILESALYSQVPKPSVCRRYEDYQDQVARVAALVLERCLTQDLNDPEDQFDAVMRQTVQDRLIAGMGVAWLRFETETTDVMPKSEGGQLTNFSQSIQPHSDHPYDGFTVPPASESSTNVIPFPPGVIVPLKKIVDQRVAVDYVHWQDFFFSPCRTWDERRWVARRVYMNRTQLEKRFGKEKAELTRLNFSVTKPGHQNSLAIQPTHEVFQMAIVFEIWDRVARKVLWYSEGYTPGLLDTKDDFLHLQSFEPVPRPMFANITTSNCMPRPDYYMIQDQYVELNTVNARISLLVQACKVVGVYDQAAKAVHGILTGNENTMVPVENWGQFSEKGGMKGSVDWIPLDQIVAAMQRLYEAREAIKGQIYELTGIADIVRGASKASETLGAQQIKAQFASIRIKKLQDEVARFASDILRIKAEIMVKHFTPDTLIRRSGITHTDNNAFIPEAIALLKSEAGFKWRVEVQSDSMAQADYASEKKDRIEFMSAVTGFLGQAMPMAMQVPELKPIMMGMLKWGIASFKGASDIEGMIDKQLSMLEGKPPQQKPNPAEITAQAKIKQTEMAGQIAMQKAQADQQAAQQDAVIEQQKAEQEMAMKREEMQLKREEHDMEMAFEREKMALEKEKMGMDLQTTIQKGQIDMNTHQQVAQQKVQDAMIQSDLNRQKGEQALEQSEATHQQALRQAKSQPKD